MICRKCNKEIENNVNVCPYCGESYGENDYFQQMLEHAMGDNTQSSEEMEKLKYDLGKKKRKSFKKILLWVIIALLGLSAVASGVWYLITNVFVDRGDAVYTASFDGNTFALLNEEGNKIREITQGTYSEYFYDQDGNCTLSANYHGLVSFEKTDYGADFLPAVAYKFDGTTNYTYKDLSYETDENGKIVRVFEKGTEPGMKLYFYDRNQKTRMEQYALTASRKHEVVYDSVGRITGEKDYDDAGNLVYDREFSYLPDGSLYLSSENKIEKRDGAGMPLSYRLTKYHENGSLMEALINDTKGNLINKILYTHEGGNLAGEKIYNPEGVEIGAKIFQYNEDGSLSREVRGGSAGSGSVWYIYQYHENKMRSVVATAYEKDSADYITYSEYDTRGREIKNITKNSHVEYEYKDSDRPVKKSVFKDGKLSEYTTFEYDEEANCISETRYDSQGSITEDLSYEYDEYGNMTKKTSSPGDIYIYLNSYDSDGGLFGVDTYYMSSAEDYEYEGENLVKKTDFGSDNKALNSVGYKWRKDGLLSARYTYSGDNVLISGVEFEYTDGVQTGLKYTDAKGKQTGSGKIEYDDRLKIVNLTCRGADDKIYYSLEYNYSKNAPEIKIEGVNTSSYSYDYSFNEEGRLSETVYQSGNGASTIYSYSYDELGNPVGGKEVRSIEGTTSETKYSYTFENGCLYTSTIKQNGKERSVTYELDENKRPFLKGSAK